MSRRLSDLPAFSVGNTIQLVGAIYAGEGELLFCPLPGEEGVVGGQGELLLMSAEEWAEFLGRTDSQQVQLKEGLYKAIVRKCERQIDTALTWACYRRDGYVCAYCGVDDVPLTVDHLVLWEEGGPTVLENLLTCCKRCNRTRGNMQYAEWLECQYYKEVSGKLAAARREANLALAGTLAGIIRVSHIKKR